MKQHDKADQSHSESDYQSETESVKQRHSLGQRSVEPASPQKSSNPAAISSPHTKDAAVKVNKWNGQELRVALDDLLAKVSAIRPFIYTVVHEPTGSL